MAMIEKLSAKISPTGLTFVFAVTAFMLSLSGPVNAAGEQWSPTEIDCQGTSCDEPISYLVYYSVCSALVQGFPISEIPKGTISSDGVEQEAPFFFVTVEEVIARRIGLLKNEEETMPNRAVLHIVARNGKAYIGDRPLPEAAEEFFTQHCKRLERGWARET